MALRLGDVAPNFKAQTTDGEIDFYEYPGNGWGILFSHPAVSTEDAIKKFPKGVKVIKPYLRYTPQPDL